MESSISKLLRFGVALSALVVLLGGILYLRSAALSASSSPVPGYAHFVAEPASSRSVQGMLLGLEHLDAATVIEVGLLLLIATPIARVAFAVVGFARQRDGLYVVISALVLVILIYSLLQGGP